MALFVSGPGRIPIDLDIRTEQMLGQLPRFVPPLDVHINKSAIRRLERHRYSVVPASNLDHLTYQGIRLVDSLNLLRLLFGCAREGDDHTALCILEFAPPPFRPKVIVQLGDLRGGCPEPHFCELHENILAGGLFHLCQDPGAAIFQGTEMDTLLLAE